MSDKDIQSKIKELEKVIDGYEDTDPNYMIPTIRELRHRVIFIHTRMDTNLSTLILKDVQEKFPRINDVPTRTVAIVTILELLDELRFQTKLKLLKQWKVLTPSLCKKLKNLNNIRNEFSHPKFYKLNKYESNKQILETLKSLVDLYEEMDKIFTQFRLWKP